MVNTVAELKHENRGFDTFSFKYNEFCESDAMKKYRRYRLIPCVGDDGKIQFSSSIDLDSGSYPS